MTVRAADIVAHARGFAEARVRWKHQGRSERGMDCGGVWVVACHRAGFPMADAPPGYSRSPTEYSFIEVFESCLDRVLPVDGRFPVQDGDVIISRGETYPIHASVAYHDRLGKLWIVEAHAGMRRVIERPMDAERWSKVTHVFRVPGVEA